MDKIIKNYGLILEPLSPEDWSFGSSGLGLEIRRADSNWTDFLPTGEKQRRNDDDKMWCVSASALNTIETEFGYSIARKEISVEDLKWLENKGYLDENGKPDCSDRYTAIASGTSASGNSPKNVAQAICVRTKKSEEWGLIPERMFPYRQAMTWKQCYGYDKNETPHKKLITQEMINLGREFLARFPINYEFPEGGKKQFDEAQKYNPLQVFVHAWNGVSNGVYVRTTNGVNHAVERHNIDQIFDTYEPYVKNLAPDFIYTGYGVRFIIQIKKKKGEFMLQRKRGEKEVYLILDGERIWIKSEEDFNLLKKSQPIQDIEWEKIVEVDNFNLPFEGRIIGKPDFSVSELLKMLFGKMSGNGNYK